MGPTFDIINAREHGRHHAWIKRTLVNDRTALDQDNDVQRVSGEGWAARKHYVTNKSPMAQRGADTARIPRPYGPGNRVVKMETSDVMFWRSIKLVKIAYCRLTWPNLRDRALFFIKCLCKLVQYLLYVSLFYK